MAKRLNVALDFTANTSQAKNQIQELSNLLNQIAYGSDIKVNTASLKEAQSAAKELAYHLNRAYNPESGKIDLSSFNKSLKESGTNVTKLSQNLLQAGSTGQQAFVSLARSIAQAEQPIVRVNGLLTEMWTTMKNTARWQITSSVLHGFIGSLQQAVGYAKDLNKTLTDIRIVAPEKSMEDMYKFSALANKQAKELSSTTLDYAKGALIYYQQGLDDIATKERTDVTTKMANVTGDSVDEVSSYMTSIWNNFNKAGDESAEHFADILTKLGAETAASTTEITTALEKYTGVANTIGLSYESATAAATTLIDRLREQPEVAGTALKTIFARLEGLKLEGSTDEGGLTTDLNKYSNALHQIGVEIKDANGEIRAADDILMDIGKKWNSGELTQDVKIATAETVAGIRQWQQFAALMDNFEYFEKYKDMAATGSEGSLQEQQDIYAESWEAASNRVKTAIQSIYMDLLNDKAFIKVLNVIADLTNGLDGFIDKIGGLKGVLVALGSFVLAGIRTKIEPAIQNLVQNVQVLTGGAQKAYAKINQETEQSINSALKNTSLNPVQQQELKNSAQMLNIKSKIALVEKDLTTQEKARLDLELEAIQAQQDGLTKEIEKLEELRELKKQYINDGLDVDTSKKTEKIANDLNRNRRKELESSDVDFFRRDELLNDISYVDAAAEQAASNNSAALKELTKNFINFKGQVSTFRGADIFKETSNSLRALAKDASQEVSSIKAIKDSFSTYTRGLQTAIKENKNLEQAMKNVYAASDYQTLAKNITIFTQELTRAKISGSELKKYMIDLGATKANIQQLDDIFIKLDQQLELTAEETKRVEIALKSVEQQAQHTVGGIEAISAAAAGLGQLAMVMFSLKSIFETLNDPDISGWEKFATLAMSISMLIPAMIGSVSSFKTAFLGLGGALSKATGATITFRGATIATAKAEGVATGATKTLGKALTELVTKNPLILVAFLALTAVIAGLAYAFKKSYDESHKARNAYKEIKEANEELNANLESTKSKAEGLSSSLETVENAAQKLQEVDFGSSQWTEELTKANEASSDLIDTYAELRKTSKELEGEEFDLNIGSDYYIDGSGLRQFTEDGKIKIEKVQAITVHNAEVTLNANKIAEQKAKIDADIEKLNAPVSGIEGSTVYQAQDATTLAQGAYAIWNHSKLQTNERPEDVDEKAYAELLSQLPDFSADRLTDEEWLKANGFDDNFIEALKNSEEYQAGIYQIVQDMKVLQEQQVKDYEDQLLKNQEVQEGLFDKDKSGLTAEEREKWSGGIVSTMAQDMQERIDTRSQLSEKELIKGQYSKRYEARSEFAAQNGMEYDASSKTFTKKDEETGETTKLNYDDIKKQYKEWLATAEAEEQATNNLENYKKEIKDSEEDWKALDRIAETIQDQEKAIVKASNTLKKKYGGDVKRLFKDTTKDAKSAQKEFQNLADTIKDDLSEALDVDPSNTIIDGEFVAQNLGLIQDAMNGDIAALEELRDIYAASEVESVFKLNFGDDAFEEAKSELNSKIAEIQAGMDDIAIGMELSPSVIQSVNELLATCARTREDAEAILDGFGIDAEITDTTVPASKYDAESDNVEGDSYQTDSLPLYSVGIDANETGFSTSQKKVGEIPVYGVKYTKKGTTKQTKESPEEKVATWKIKTTKDGGKVPTKKQVTLPRSGGSGGKKNTGSNGGKSGGGSSRPKKGSGSTRVERARKSYDKTTVVKRYKEITDQLTNNEKATKRLTDLSEKLYGKDRLSAMDKVNKKHLAEIKLLRTKAKEADNYLAKDKQSMKERYNEMMNIAKDTTRFTKKYLSQAQRDAVTKAAKTGLKIGSDGTVTSYTTIMTALQTELNALERMYNNFKGTAEDQSTFKEEKITPLKEAIDRFQEAIDQYDETRELIQDLKDQINEAYTEWQNLNYEKLTYSLEIKMTVNDNDLKFLEHKISQIQDNIYKSAEVLDYYVSGSGDTKLKNITDAIKIQTNNFKELDKAYQNGKITQDQYREGLQTSYEALMSNVDALTDLKKELTDYYSNVLNDAMSEMDKYITKADHVNSLIDHYKNILDLTGKSTDYNLIEQLQAANAVTATTLINMNKAEYEAATYEADKYLKAYNEIKAKIDERQKTIGNAENDKILQNLQDEAEVMRKAYEAAIETANDAEQQMFSSVQEALENAAASLETALERAAKAVEKALTGIVGSFDELARQMNLTSTRQDEYLTKTNQSYELNKMQRTLAKDMDKTDSRAAKTRLANFSKELKALEEKDELSNLELQIAQKKYELLKAQIALEDSQNAKSVIRLSRDNEGNYGYVYVANEEQTEDAEQAVEDAKNDLYNLQLEATNNYGQKYTQVMQEYLAAIAEVQADRNLTDEDRQYRLNKLQEQYGSLIGSMQDLYGIAWGATDYLVEPLQQEAWVYKNYNDNLDLMTNNLGALNSYINDTNGSIDVFNTQIKNITDYVNFEQRMDDVVKTTEDTMNQLSKDFEETGEQMTKILNDVGNKITDFVNTSIATMNKWITDTDNIIQNIQNIIENATNGKIDRSTEKLNEFLVKWSNGATLKYTDNHIAYNDTKGGAYNTIGIGLSSSAKNWSADTIAKNEVTAEKLLNAFESGKSGYFGFDKNGLLSFITEVSTSDDAYKKWKKNVKGAKAFDTGGYTGEWTDDGKIAVLHEKELVLNETDTKNILNAVNIVRDRNFLTALSSPSFSMGIDGQQLEQNVKIEAQFPNVTDRYEIEQAFNNLVNRASQHAFNNRK